MANMTFKANLLPNSNLEYSLGSSSLQWNVYGTFKGNADTATKISSTPNNTSTFLRGDNTWSNTMEGEAPYWTIKTNNESNYAVLRFATLNKSEAAVLFLNAPSRTGDGGANMLTLRNNVGNLRLNNNTINTGLFTIGDTSLNTSYNLYVNGTAKINTSVFSGQFIYDWKGSSNQPMLVLRDAENYGIRYHEGDPDKMMISASGNANSVNADLCINGAGDGTVTIRGQTIFHTGNNLFRGVAFYSGQSNSQEHNCNNITYNGHFYYTSNGPSDLGEQSTDGSLYTQAYSSDWVTQIAADYRTGKLYVRSKKNGTWQSWLKTWYKGESVTGAVWNDYAEYRESHIILPGYVVQEIGDDTLQLTTQRLDHFAGVTSDTWGFAQGETEKAKTPIAVAGRVLVYPGEDRDSYKPGDCVCAGPNGKVYIMTREEVRDWPDRIVGTVSCVPDYEMWGGGEGADKDPVKVNGRIWIKVK